MDQTEFRELQFHRQTQNFEIIVTFKERRLCVTLKDYVDWAIYAKTYFEEDIGKEIHRKMDLLDVFCSFSESEGSCDEALAESKEEHQQNGCYQFGEIIKDQGVPSYKVDKQGKITAYQTVVDIKTKKKIQYVSQLVLDKVRNFTETQIIAEQNYKKNKKLKKQIYHPKYEKETLFKKILNLEQENTKLKSQFENIKKQLSSKNIETDEKINLITKQLNQFKQISGQKIVQIRKQLSLKQKEINRLIFQRRNNLFNLPQLFVGCFKTQELKVKYIDKDAYTHFMINKPIYYNQSGKLLIKVIKTKNNYIFVGVNDYVKQRDRRFSFNTGNSMCYFGFSGHIFPENVKKGDGFKEGDIVKVIINRATHTLDYYVNGEIKVTHVNKMLTESSQVFMPFVEMYSCGDIVEFLEQSKEVQGTET